MTGLTPAQTAYWDQVMGRVAASDEWKGDVQKNLWGEHYLNSRDAKAFKDFAIRCTTRGAAGLGIREVIFA